MRFGFGTVPAGPPRQTLALVQFAEQLGFEVAWMPDQTFYRDPYVTLAACVQGTKSITLGISVTNPYTRHPAMTARAAATLSELCNGRFILGIGAGNRKEMIDLLGLPSDHPGARCREAVLTIKRLLDGQQVVYHSPTLKMDGIALEMTPPPWTPVYLAARGPQILESAGELADGVIIGALASEPGLSYALKRVRIGADKAGRTLDELEVVSWVTVIVTEHKSAIVDRLRPFVAHAVGGAPENVLEVIGLTKARIAEIKRTYAHGGPNGAAGLVDPHLVDMLTVVGEPTEIVERLSSLAEAGVDQLAVLMPGGSTGSHSFPEFDHRRNLERIASDVIPLLRSSTPKKTARSLRQVPTT